MSELSEAPVSANLADEALQRTTAPAAHSLDHDEQPRPHAVEWPEIGRIIAVAVAAVAVWFQLGEPFPSVSVIGVAGIVFGGWPIFREAFENLAARRMTMELSMSIAIVAAAAISEFFTALVITL